jgi:DNA-binding NtrC family response regulator
MSLPLGTAEKERSILIIDNDPSILRTLNRILSKAGYAVDLARSGIEGVEKFSVKSYDAVIIDVGLGDMQGTDLLPQMQRVAPRMLRIILTGTPMPESTLDMAKRDADIFMLKPAKPEALIRILKENLRSQDSWVSK